MAMSISGRSYVVRIGGQKLMQYLLLIYADEKDWASLEEATQKAEMGKCIASGQEFAEHIATLLTPTHRRAARSVCVMISLLESSSREVAEADLIGPGQC
jgi:hypothetical protein